MNRKSFFRFLYCLAVVFLLAISISGCKNDPIDDNQIEQNDWTRNIRWQGEYSSFPYNPEEGYAFYNTSDGYSYVYISAQGWTPIAKSGLGLTWLGERSDYPSNPSYGQAFFHTTLGNSYVYDGTSWRLLAKSGANGTNGTNGVDGKNGSSGILSWVGEFASAPSNPSDGTAYHNTTDGKSYIYTNNKWSILAVDGTGIKWVGELGYAPSSPTVNTAYFNTSDNTAYIWNGTAWTTLAVSPSVNYVVSVQWKGNLYSAPYDPSVGWMYYNTTQGKSYIWDGSCWEVVASDGVSPVGFLITWKGSSATAPENPQQGWCYHNSHENCSFIFDGNGWKLMVRGDSSAGLHTPSGGKLEVSVDDTILNLTGSTNYTYIIDYDAAKNSETKTVTIKNVGSEPVYFSEEGPIAFSSNTSLWYYDEAEFDSANILSSLDPGASFSMTITYDPSKMVYSYIYLYNTSLHNPLGISFIQSNSSGINSTSGRMQYLSISESMYTPSGCHQLTSSSYSINYSSTSLALTELNFSNSKINEAGQVVELRLSSVSGYEPVYLKGDPFIWIDGENSEDFILDSSITKNLRLMNGGSQSFSIQFKPKSAGGKVAVLHISTDIEGFEEITINLKGNCSDIQNRFDSMGYALIDDHALSTSESYCKLTSDGSDGVYFISKQSSEYLLDIYHVDSFGNSSLIRTIDGCYVDYAEYSDGSLRIYTNGSICKTKYGNNYTIVVLDTDTLDYTTQAYTSEQIAVLKSIQINGKSYNQKSAYGDYVLGVKGISGYDITMDVYDTEDNMLMSINRLINTSIYNNAVCISGSFLYCYDKQCLRRINIIGLLSDI